MDNINEIDQAALNKYFGLDANNKDASGSKEMTVNQGNHEITYSYTRGGVVLTGTVNYATQETKWTCSGVNGNQNRQDAIMEGLKTTAANITFN